MTDVELNVVYDKVCKENEKFYSKIRNKHNFKKTYINICISDNPYITDTSN